MESNPINIDQNISQRVKNIKNLSNLYNNQITKDTINNPNNKELKTKDDALIAIINNGIKLSKSSSNKGRIGTRRRNTRRYRYSRG